MARETREQAIERGWSTAASVIPEADKQEAHIREAIGIGWDLLHPEVEKYRLQW